MFGTAFDYLRRFYVGRLNTSRSYQRWVAEEAMELTHDDPRLYRKAASLYEIADNAHFRYLKTGLINDEFTEGVIYLAQLDVIFGAGIVPPDLGEGRGSEGGGEG